MTSFGHHDQQRGADQRERGGDREARVQDLLRVSRHRGPRHHLREEYGRDRHRQVEQESADERRATVDAGVVRAQRHLGDDQVDRRQRGDRERADHDGHRRSEDLRLARAVCTVGVVAATTTSAAAGRRVRGNPPTNVVPITAPTPTPSGIIATRTRSGRASGDHDAAIRPKRCRPCATPRAAARAAPGTSRAPSGARATAS